MKFVVGKTYSTRSICDHDCIISATVVKRTASTVTLTSGYMGRDQKTFRVSINCDGAEQFAPWGRYSMAPMIRAA
jgi:hypothetical protein